MNQWIYIVPILLIAIYLVVCFVYYFIQEKLIFVPLGIFNDDEKIELGTEFSEVYLDGVEGGRIHCLHMKVPNAKGCILYFHGNTGNMHRWAPIAEELTSFGFDVFVPDYRGYGKSRGLRTQETLYADALLCYGYLKGHYPEKELCIYGRSLGSAMATWLAGRTEPGGVVLETPFNNLRDVAAKHSWFIPVGILLKFGFRNELHLKHSKSPVLIAHGTADRIVPHKCGLALFKTAKSKAEMVTIPGGHHGDLNGFPLFRDSLKAFFEANFPQEPTAQH